MLQVHTISDKFGLRVSSTRTEVQCIGRERQEMKIVLGNNELVQCEDFIYLGGVISQDSTCDRCCMENRISGRYCQKPW